MDARSWTIPRRARRYYVVAPYLVDSSGSLRVKRPDVGPCGDGISPCRVVVHHRRKRTTAIPWAWLAVLRCEAHQVAFTAYPPGYPPYARLPLVGLAPDGGHVGPEPGSALPNTVLEAAGDAPSRATLRRRVLRGAALLGLTACVDEELAAAVLHLPAGVIREHGRRLKRAHGLCAWRAAVTTLLRELPPFGGLWVADRLALLGHLAGRWGRPYRWSAGRTPRLLLIGDAFLHRQTAEHHPQPSTRRTTEQPTTSTSCRPSRGYVVH